MTPTIQFYHLLHTTLSEALTKLLEKILAQQSRALIRVADEKSAQALSTALWQGEALLPHGTSADPTHAKRQPIYITWREEHPNQSDILIVTCDVIPTDLTVFTKLLDIFDGRDEVALVAARKRFSHYKKAGHPLQYITQQLTGGWKIDAAQ